MPCHFIPGGFVGTGGRRRSPPRCGECRNKAEFLCDYPTGNGPTCDRPLCADHAHAIGPDRHYCDAHYRRLLAAPRPADLRVLIHPARSPRQWAAVIVQFPRWQDRRAALALVPAHLRGLTEDHIRKFWEVSRC